MAMSERTGSILAMATALAAGLAAAAGAFFIPNATLESAISATGIGEYVAAARPPLGDTARLVVAIALGWIAAAFVLAVFPLHLFNGTAGSNTMRRNRTLRREPEPEFVEAVPEPEIETKERKTLMDRLRALRFGKNTVLDDEISGFDEIPRLRERDTHPDAPARRPIRANRDFGPVPEPSPGPEVNLDAGPLTSDESDLPRFLRRGRRSVAEEVDVLADQAAALQGGFSDAAPDDFAPVEAPVEEVVAEVEPPRFRMPEPDPEPVYHDQADHDEERDRDVRSGQEPQSDVYEEPLAEEPMAEPEPIFTAERPPRRDPVPQIDESRPLSDYSISELTDRLEAGLRRRGMIAGAPLPPRPAAVTAPMASDQAASDPRAADLPEVPIAPNQPEDMDAALRAALETLRQMSNGGRG